MQLMAIWIKKFGKLQIRNIRILKVLSYWPVKKVFCSNNIVLVELKI